MINDNNANSSNTAKMGVNQFTDYSTQDIAGIFISKHYLVHLGNFSFNGTEAQKTEKSSLKGAGVKVTATTVPTSLDYKALGKVTSIKNQGSCGDCWSFSSTAMYESLLLFNGFPEYDLSEEESLECTYNYAPNKRMSDCKGGYLLDVVTKVGKVGTVLESSYPYIASNTSSGFPTTSGICSETNRVMVGNTTVQYSSSLSQT